MTHAEPTKRSTARLVWFHTASVDTLVIVGNSADQLTSVCFLSHWSGFGSGAAGPQPATPTRPARSLGFWSWSASSASGGRQR